MLLGADIKEDVETHLRAGNALVGKPQRKAR